MDHTGKKLYTLEVNIHQIYNECDKRTAALHRNSWILPSIC
jgi:hypothetical protein